MQAELDASMAQQGILPIIHPEAFYSNAADVPDRPVVFAGLQFKVPSSSVGNLPLFTRDPAAGSTSMMELSLRQCKVTTVFAVLGYCISGLLEMCRNTTCVHVFSHIRNCTAYLQHQVHICTNADGRGSVCISQQGMLQVILCSLECNELCMST